MTQTYAAKGRITAALNELIAVMSNCNDIELPTPTEGRRHITASEKNFFTVKVNVAKDALIRANSCIVSKIQKAENYVANIADQEEALAYPAAIALHLQTWEYASVCQAYDTSLGRLYAMLASLLVVEVEEDNEVPHGGNENIIAGANDQNASTIENETDSMVETRRLSHHASSLLRMATPANRSSSPNIFGFARDFDARALNLSGIQEEEGEGINYRRTTVNERDNRDNFNWDRGVEGQHDRRNRGAGMEAQVVTMQNVQDVVQDLLNPIAQQMANLMAMFATTAAVPINATAPATGMVTNHVAATTPVATTASAGSAPAVIPQSVAAIVMPPVSQVQGIASQTQVPLAQNAQTGTAQTASTTAPAAGITPPPGFDPLAIIASLTRRKAKVPSLTVPIFDGTPEKYHDWWRTFAYTVHDNADMSPGERIMYLKQCTIGEAEEMLSPYNIDETSYDECIAALKRRYENRLDESQRIFKKLSELPTCRFEAKALRSTFTTVQASYIALKKVEPAENNTLLLDLISKKFPEKIRQKISRKKHQLGAKWTVAAIIDMIEEYVAQEENTVRDLAKSTEIKTIANAATVYSSSDRQSRSMDRSQDYRTASRSVNRESNNPPLNNVPAESKGEGPEIACEMCGKYRHHAINCRVVKGVNERRTIIRQKRLCYICLSKNHMSSDCKEPFCEKCGRAHHVSICTASSPSADENAARTKSPYRTVVEYRDKPAEEKNDNTSDSSFRLTNNQTGTS